MRIQKFGPYSWLGSSHRALKSANPARTFGYTNLVLNAFSSDGLKTMGEDATFGGHAKGKKYDAKTIYLVLEF